MRRASLAVVLAAGCAHSPTVAGAVDVAQASMPAVNAAVDVALSGCPPTHTERCAEISDRYTGAAAEVRDALLALESVAAEIDSLAAAWSTDNAQ